jgi:hypothetical protein
LIKTERKSGIAEFWALAEVDRLGNYYRTIKVSLERRLCYGRPLVEKRLSEKMALKKSVWYSGLYPVTN